MTTDVNLSTIIERMTRGSCIYVVWDGRTRVSLSLFAKHGTGTIGTSVCTKQSMGNMLMLINIDSDAVDCVSRYP